MIILGSARIDENGNISGGLSGDQTGREVSTQNFYLHSKGWIRLRPKKSEHARKIANSMKNACDNDNFGYDQNNRAAVRMVKKYGSTKAVAEKTETDCSNLVRACIYEATGQDVGEFYTGNEKAVLENSGLFEKGVSIFCEADVCDGDILVTKTKGHTVAVVSGRPRTDGKTADDTGSALNTNQKWVGEVTATSLNVRTWAGVEFPNIKSWPLLGVKNLVGVCDSVKDRKGEDRKSVV